MKSVLNFDADRSKVWFTQIKYKFAVFILKMGDIIREVEKEKKSMCRPIAGDTKFFKKSRNSICYRA